MDISPAAPPIIRLIEELHKLPGIGPRSAQRLAYHLMRTPREEADALASAIVAVKDRVVLCAVCHTLTDMNPCSICADERRDHSRVCVVEQPLDIVALEKTRKYTGLYHVLHGALSPINGVGPGDLRIKELTERTSRGSIAELVLATNPTLEGEATAMYIHRQLNGFQGRITRLARGLPAGGDVEYADEVTLARALEGRQEMS